MERAVLISIRPEWVEKILNGEKTIEIRKTMPKCKLPCKVYIYCTNSGRPLVYGQENACVQEHYTRTYGYSKKDANKIWGVLNGKVVAEFTLNKVDTIEICDPYVFRNKEQEDWWWFKANACLDCEQIMEYIGYGNDHDGWGDEYSKGYAWHIDNLKIYDKPKELSEFYKNNYKKIIEQLEFDGCDEKRCKYAVGNSFLGDDGYCDYSMCPKLRLEKPPQSWCYVDVKGE